MGATKLSDLGPLPRYTGLRSAARAAFDAPINKQQIPSDKRPRSALTTERAPMPPNAAISPNDLPTYAPTHH
ncbi:unnamed protein product, partial [Iphiclides podalirius]